MARPREFDIDEATGRAMAVFWEQGYEGASLPDLLDGMNLTRGSLYKAFTDKKTLFLAVLERYEAEAVDGAVGLLTDPGVGDGWARIMRLFDSVAGVVEQGDRRGCLLCSAAAGPASYDEDIAETVARLLGAMHAGFAQALRDAGDAGDAAELAHLLVVQYVGLRVLARTNMPAQALRQSVQAIGRLRP